MAIPVNTDLNGMDFIFKGQPFVSVPTKPEIDTSGLDFVFQGEPFVTNPVAESDVFDNAIMFGMMF